MLEQPYVMTPKEALSQDIPLIYRERLAVRVPFYVTPSMSAAAAAEMKRDPKRYQINRQSTLQEIFRSHFLVAQRLRETNPALFFELRDSFLETKELESTEAITLESTPTPA